MAAVRQLSNGDVLVNELRRRARNAFLTEAIKSEETVEHAAEDLLGDPENEARSRLGLRSVPGAVLLGTDGLLAGGPATGLEEIEELVDAAAEEIEASMATVEREPAVQQPQ